MLSQQRQSSTRPIRALAIGWTLFAQAALLFGCVLLPAPTPGYGAVAPPFPLPPSSPPRGESLVLELGCIQCHSDLAGQSSIREQAPELSQAGLRYRTAYLFEFLQRPKQVRRHIGRARMPVSLLPELARFFGVGTDDLLGLRSAAAAKRGPAPKLQQHLQRIGRLPKTKQRAVMDVLEAMLAQSSR